MPRLREPLLQRKQSFIHGVKDAGLALIFSLLCLQTNKAPKQVVWESSGSHPGRDLGLQLPRQSSQQYICEEIKIFFLERIVTHCVRKLRLVSLSQILFQKAFIQKKKRKENDASYISTHERFV